MLRGELAPQEGGQQAQERPFCQACVSLGSVWLTVTPEQSVVGHSSVPQPTTILDPLPGPSWASPAMLTHIL